MNRKKESPNNQAGRTGSKGNGKNTKNKRIRVYPPERKYILVSKWIAPNNVLVLDRTKKGTRL